MIVRLVKLTIREETVPEFLKLFGAVEAKIRNFPGCVSLELLREVNSENIFFTYSVWISESKLNSYRFSAFFRDTWQQTKTLFAAPAEAWSLEGIVKKV